MPGVRMTLPPMIGDEFRSSAIVAGNSRGNEQKNVKFGPGSLFCAEHLCRLRHCRPGRWNERRQRPHGEYNAITLDRVTGSIGDVPNNIPESALAKASDRRKPTAVTRQTTRRA